MEQLPSRTLSRRDPEARKELILEAADALFHSVGYDDVSVAKVAKKAAVASGTVYLFFPDKPSLLIGVINRRKAKIAETVRANLPIPGEPLETSINRLVSTVFDLMIVTGPVGDTIDYERLVMLGPEAVAAFSSVDDAIQEVFAILAESSETIALDPQIMPAMISGMMMSATHLAQSGSVTNAAIKAELIRAFVRLIEKRD